MTPNDTYLLELERAVKQTTRWTTALMVLFLVLVAGTVAYAGWRAKKLTDPDALAEAAENYLQANYPQWKEEVRKQLVEQAPALAERITHSTVTSALATFAMRFRTDCISGLVHNSRGSLIEMLLPVRQEGECRNCAECCSLLQQQLQRVDAKPKKFRSLPL